MQKVKKMETFCLPSPEEPAETNGGKGLNKP
jgi:hypothetical protein